MTSVGVRLPHFAARLAGVVTTLLLAGSVLYWMPPEHFLFYPACPIRYYTGLLCPGCGGTHALAALLHGEFAEALRQNLLVALGMPAALIYFADVCRRATGSEARNGAEGIWPRVSGGTVYWLLGAAGVFTLIRNLLWGW